MANNDWERFGEEIRRTVQNAVDSQDFEKLNQTITNTINNAVDSATNGFRNMGNMSGRSRRAGSRGRQQRSFNSKGMNGQGPWSGGFQNGPWNNGPQPGGPWAGQNSSWQKPYKNMAPPVSRPKNNRPEPSPYYISTGAEKAVACILASCGYAGGGVFLITLLLAFAGAVASGFGAGFIASAAILSILIAGCAVMAGIGTSMLGRIKRFRKYVRELEGRDYGDVKVLAGRMGKPVKYVVKDLERMIRKGWFRQGHLDRQGSCLMTSHAAFDQYMQLMQQEAGKKQEEEVKRQQENVKKTDLPPEVQEVIDTGDRYIQRIHECNDAIPGEEISAKISHMEMLVDKIFDRVEQNPEAVSDIRRLMEYYLPTTVKLLEAYEDLDAQPVQGENIISAKNEIEKTLDTLNIAFEKLLDSLFQDTAWDVASDVSVLKTMLAQEGLTEDGLTGRKK